MSQANCEQMSALVDDEIDADELDVALNNLSADSALRASWDRYHLIGDALRGETLSRDVDGIADRVREALSDDSLEFVPRHKGIPRHWLGPMAGSALAASVAVVAVVAWPDIFQDADPGGGFPGAALVDPTLVDHRPPAPTRYMDRSSTHWGLKRPEVETKLNSYLVNHQEYAPAAGMKGMLPYTTFASYDAQR